MKLLLNNCELGRMLLACARQHHAIIHYVEEISNNVRSLIELSTE